jgi:hypothetical protein
MAILLFEFPTALSFGLLGYVVLQVKIDGNAIIFFT